MELKLKLYQLRTSSNPHSSKDFKMYLNFKVKKQLQVDPLVILMQPVKLSNAISAVDI